MVNNVKTFLTSIVLGEVRGGEGGEERKGKGGEKTIYFYSFDHHATFGCCFSYYVRACIGGPKNLGTVGSTPLDVTSLSPKKHASLYHLCYHAKFGHSII